MELDSDTVITILKLRFNSTILVYISTRKVTFFLSTPRTWVYHPPEKTPKVMYTSIILNIKYFMGLKAVWPERA